MTTKKNTTEQTKKTITLGPDGSNSAMAAKKWCEKTGRSTDDIKYYDDIEDIVRAVKSGDANYGIVAIENMRDGSVVGTLDILEEYQANIYDEIYVKISFRLLAKNRDVPITTILSHPKAFAQCRKNLKNRYDGVLLIPTTSTSAAAAKALNNSGFAAIASLEAAEKFGLIILDEHIQDKRENHTRFLVISNHETLPSENDKTSIIVYPCLNKPGVLYEILGEFANRNIDLTRTESRPNQNEEASFGQYVFHIDLKGNRKNAVVQEAFKSILEKEHRLRVLGSYPIAMLNGEV